MHRRALLFLFASVALLGCAKDGAKDGAKDKPASESATAELKPLTVDQVSDRIAAKDGKTYVFDNNSKESWAKGHVPTAAWVDDENVTTATMPADKAATLIFYCHDET